MPNPTENRVATKRQLKTLNNKAVKAGNKAVTDEFFLQLRGDLRYVVQRTPFGDFGWQRCMVFYATDKDGSDFSHVLLDMTEADWERLPLVEDILALTKAFVTLEQAKKLAKEEVTK